MVNGIRTSDSRELNKGRGSKFHVGSRVRHEWPEEGQRTYQSKRCECNNTDENIVRKPWMMKILTIVIKKSEKESYVDIKLPISCWYAVKHKITLLQK